MGIHKENERLCRKLRTVHISALQVLALYIRRIDTVFLEFIHQCTATDAQH